MEDTKTENKIDYNSQKTEGQRFQTNPKPAYEPQMSKRSRLNKHLERQGKKTIIISIIGIVIILAFLLRFGIPFIADLGSLSSQVTSSVTNKNEPSAKPTVFLSSPTLNSPFDATNSAKVTITGASTTGKQVAIYLNGSLFKKVDIDSDGTFSQDMDLSDGDNIIKAKATDGSEFSDYSDPITITYKTSAPNLSIDSPHDGDTVKNSPINISGTTDPDTKVTVNDFWAILDSAGNYSYSLNLQNGDNNIKVDAIDPAGNKVEKTIKVTYSP